MSSSIYAVHERLPSTSVIHGSHNKPSSEMVSKKGPLQHRDSKISARHTAVSSESYELSPAHWNQRREQNDLTDRRTTSVLSRSGTERLPRVKELDQLLPSSTVSLSATTSSRADASNAQQRLSIYESPTATYMWPRFDPTSQVPQADRPVIFVKYKPSPASVPSTVPSRSQSFDAQPHPCISHRVDMTSTGDQTRYSRKRSSSIETDSSPGSPSDRVLKHPRTLQTHRFPNVVDSSSSAGHITSSFDRSSPRSERDLPATFGRLDIDSEQSDEDTVRSFRQHQLRRVHSATHGRCHQASVGPDQRYPNVSRMAAADTAADFASGEEWLKYAHAPQSSGSTSQYTCSWPIQDTYGHTTPCGYSSKRHLVKRHIESKHLQLRPCVCRICGKGFSQKSNLETHLNTHTGEAPHKCPYPNCEEYFKDPARRHRHMKAVHQHISSRTKKNRKQPDGSSLEDSDPEESPITRPAL